MRTTKTSKFAAKNRTIKVIKRASSRAVKRVDKLQNVALKSLARKVNKLSRMPELKYFTLNTGILSVSSGGSWFNGLSKDIQIGTTDTERIGDSINAKSIHIKGSLNLPPMIQTAFVRLILVRYMESYQLSSPLIGDLLVSNDYRSFYQPETKNQFRILFDKTYNMSQQIKPQIQIKIHKNLSNARVLWDSGAIINGPTTGQLFLYMISDQPTGGPGLPLIDFTSMLYFTSF